MPIVHIDLIEGRSPEQIKGMVKDVTEAIAKNTGAPQENVHIVLNEMNKDNYSVGGKLKSEQ
ncbi:2-hydroxymuconate tautomerase [Holzapfeliella sp. He02]|uniref:Tautomerase n=1 Tax=Holzapfeliella saturejae TaxID=3082953 RepID=A0ABU8SGH7_9LACO